MAAPFFFSSVLPGSITSHIMWYRNTASIRTTNMVSATTNHSSVHRRHQPLRPPPQLRHHRSISVTAYSPPPQLRHHRSSSDHSYDADTSCVVHSGICTTEKPTILMKESVVVEESAKKSKRKPFKGLDGFMKWKKSDDLEKDTVPLSLNDSAKETYKGIHEGTDSKMKRKLHTDGSSSDFFVDKVLGDKIKKELMKTKSELQLSDDQIEVISTRLPIDKTDLKKWTTQLVSAS
ncbi:uncharacterized protein LOC143589603 [Bidens hawaiensis]|uniref:uncharacterized protein LOC143589603 n=1 Tax=Bidens hawaiensis TaxID=980011 RepID=UPI00404A148F